MWFSRSYRGAIESNIAWTAAAASCSPVVPAGCAPRVCTVICCQLQPGLDGPEQFVIGQVIHHAGMSDVLQEDEVADAANSFLVAGSRIEQAAGSETRERRQTQCVDRGQDAARLRIG